MRKLLTQFWVKRGTNGKKANNMTDGQIFVVFSKYRSEIETMLENIRNMRAYYSHMEENFYEARLHQTQKEIDDYAFEE